MKTLYSILGLHCLIIFLNCIKTIAMEINSSQQKLQRYILCGPSSIFCLSLADNFFQFVFSLCLMLAFLGQLLLSHPSCQPTLPQTLSSPVLFCSVILQLDVTTKDNTHLLWIVLRNHNMAVNNSFKAIKSVDARNTNKPVDNLNDFILIIKTRWGYSTMLWDANI